MYYDVFFNNNRFYEYLKEGHFFIDIFQSAKVTNLSACLKMKEVIEHFVKQEKYEEADLCAKQLNFFLRGGEVDFNTRNTKKIIHIPNTKSEIIKSMDIPYEISQYKEEELKWMQKEQFHIVLASLFAARKISIIKDYAIDPSLDNNILFELYPDSKTPDEICYSIMEEYVRQIMVHLDYMQDIGTLEYYK